MVRDVRQETLHVAGLLGDGGGRLVARKENLGDLGGPVFRIVFSDGHLEPLRLPLVRLRGGRGRRGKRQRARQDQGNSHETSFRPLAACPLAREPRPAAGTL